MAENRFIGTWRLLSFEQQAEDGQITNLFGHDPVGYIMYNADGYMFVAFMHADRPSFATEDYFAASLEERVAAMDTFLSYCGRYSIRGDRVIHHIEVCYFPNWVGMDQERIYAFEGDKLTLSTEPFVSGGKQRSAHLVLQRV